MQASPVPIRVLMALKTQMYMGERWELVFVKDARACAPMLRRRSGMNSITWSFRLRRCGCSEMLGFPAPS